MLGICSYAYLDETGHSMVRHECEDKRHTGGAVTSGVDHRLHFLIAWRAQELSTTERAMSVLISVHRVQER